MESRGHCVYKVAICMALLIIIQKCEFLNLLTKQFFLLMQQNLKI